MSVRSSRSKIILNVGVGCLVLGIILMLVGVIMAEANKSVLQVSTGSDGTVNITESKDPEPTNASNGPVVNVNITKNPVRTAGYAMLYSGVALTLAGIVMMIVAENKKIKNG